MKLTKQQVEHIAKLARLGLSEDEKKKFQEQLSSILGYVEKLNQLNTEKIEPTAHAVGTENVIREDEAHSTEEEVRKRILEEAPDKEDDLVKVKRVFE